MLINKRKSLIEYIDFKILALTTNSRNAEFEMFEQEKDIR